MNLQHRLGGLILGVLFFTHSLCAHVSSPVAQHPLRTLAQEQLAEILKSAQMQTDEEPTEEALNQKRKELDAQLTALCNASAEQETQVRKKQQLLTAWSILAPVVLGFLSQKNTWGAYFPSEQQSREAVQHAQQLLELEKLLSSSSIEQFSNEVTLAQLTELIEYIRQDLEERLDYITGSDRDEIIKILQNRRRMLEGYLVALEKSIAGLKPHSGLGNIWTWVGGSVLLVGISALALAATYDEDGFHAPSWERLEANGSAALAGIAKLFA